MQIEQDEVGPRGARHRERRLAVGGRDRFVLLQPDDAEREIHACRVVFHDQYAGHRHVG